VTRRARQRLVACSAAFAAPLLWAVSTQDGLILPYADCAQGHRWTAIATLATCVLALLAGAICWNNRPLGRPEWFACAVGALLALLLAFAIALQAVAGIMLTGCER
jgi:hypothetical protein